MDITVIGAGLAGLTSAIKASDNGANVLLASPSYSYQSQSVMAMGGINAALNTKGEDDSIKQHYDDTINGGNGLNLPNAVQKLTNDAPKIVKWLAEIGTVFNRDENNNIDLRYFGGQKKMRTAYAGARTGKQIMTSLNSLCLKKENEGSIKRLVGWRFLSLILQENECIGVILYNEDTSQIKSFYCDAVIIASGGLNGLFGKTSGSVQNDGVTTARLFKQGVELANLEMIQYHPTTVDTPVKRMLITEAARGEGGKLYAYRNGEKWYFMKELYPQLAELMPRDVVSRSIYKVCEELNLDYVYLDISHLPEELIKTKLDEVYQIATDYLGIDPTKEPIPVYPGIHYFMGGIRTDENHKTNIKRLFAAGECSSQYHGANRLGGNSLLGAVHGGWVAGQIASQLDELSTHKDDAYLERELNDFNNWKNLKGDVSLFKAESELANIMKNAMSVYRDYNSLNKAILDLDKLSNYNICCRSYYGYIKFYSLLDLAKAMIYSAIERKESRGAHQRTDYPETNDEKYRKTTCISLNPDFDIEFKELE